MADGAAEPADITGAAATSRPLASTAGQPPTVLHGASECVLDIPTTPTAPTPPPPPPPPPPPATAPPTGTELQDAGLNPVEATPPPSNGGSSTTIASPSDTGSSPAAHKQRKHKKLWRIEPDAVTTKHVVGDSDDEGPHGEMATEEEEEGNAIANAAASTRLFTRWHSFLVWTVVFALIVGIAALFEAYGQRVTVQGGSIANWAAFVCVNMVLFPVWQRLVWAVQVLVKWSQSGSVWSLYFISSYPYVATFLWSITLLVSFKTLFHLNPFPVAGLPGGLRTPLWIDHALVTVIALCLLLVLKHVILAMVGLQRRTSVHEKRVSTVIRMSRVLSRLGRQLPSRKFDAKDYVVRQFSPIPTPAEEPQGSASPPLAAGAGAGLRVAVTKVLRKRRRQRLVEKAKKEREKHGTMGHFMPEVGNVETQGDTSINWRQLLVDVDELKQSQLTICRGTRAIKTIKQAKRLGNLICDMAMPNGATAQKGIPMHALLKRFKPDEAALKEECNSLFDPTGRGTTNRRVLVKGCVNVLLERRHMIKSIFDVDGVVDALGYFLSIVITFITFLFFVVLFSQGSYSEIAISFGTFSLALSFIFSETCKNMFNSFVFLFVRAPFDTGDRVTISEEWEGNAYYVSRMGLFTTTFRHWSGTVLTIPNHVLYNKTIFNMRRSGNIWDWREFLIHYKTHPDKIRIIEQDLRSMMIERSDQFDESKFFFFVTSFVDGDKLLVELYPAYRSNWQDGEHLHRRTLLIETLMETCLRENIEYYPPVQRYSADSRTPFGGDSPRAR